MPTEYDEPLYDDNRELDDDAEQSAYDPEEDLFYEDGLEDEGDLDYDPEYADE